MTAQFFEEREIEEGEKERVFIVMWNFTSAPRIHTIHKLSNL